MNGKRFIARLNSPTKYEQGSHYHIVCVSIIFIIIIADHVSAVEIESIKKNCILQNNLWRKIKSFLTLLKYIDNIGFNNKMLYTCALILFIPS